MSTQTIAPAQNDLFVADFDDATPQAPAFQRFENLTVAWDSDNLYQQVREQYVAEQRLVPQLRRLTPAELQTARKQRYDDAIEAGNSEADANKAGARVEAWTEVRSIATGNIIYQKAGDTRFLDIVSGELYNRKIRRIQNGANVDIVIDAEYLGPINGPRPANYKQVVKSFVFQADEGTALRRSAGLLYRWCEQCHAEAPVDAALLQRQADHYEMLTQQRFAENLELAERKQAQLTGIMPEYQLMKQEAIDLVNDASQSDEEVVEALHWFYLLQNAGVELRDSITQLRTEPVLPVN